MSRARETQVGGDHYSRHKIQPIEYCMANNMNAIQAHVVKYITRYPFKGCPIEDLEKIKHLCDLEMDRLKESEARGA